MSRSPPSPPGSADPDYRIEVECVAREVSIEFVDRGQARQHIVALVEALRGRPAPGWAFLRGVVDGLVSKHGAVTVPRPVRP